MTCQHPQSTVNIYFKYPPQINLTMNSDIIEISISFEVKLDHNFHKKLFVIYFRSQISYNNGDYLLTLS